MFIERDTYASSKGWRNIIDRRHNKSFLAFETASLSFVRHLIPELCRVFISIITIITTNMSNLVTVQWLCPKRYAGVVERIVQSRIRGELKAELWSKGNVARETLQSSNCWYSWWVSIHKFLTLFISYVFHFNSFGI